MGEDTMDIRLFEQIRELHFCDEELQWELIPMRRVMGRIYPPEDIWRDPDHPTSSKANRASSASKKKRGPKKADSARRLKVPRNSQGGFLDENSEEEGEGSNKNDGVSKSKKPASRNVKKNIRKGKK